MNKIKNEIKLTYNHIEDIDLLLYNVFKNVKKEDLKKLNPIEDKITKKKYIKNSVEIKNLVKKKNQIHQDLIKINQEFKITYSPKKIRQQIDEKFVNNDDKIKAYELLEYFTNCNNKLKILNKTKFMN